MIKQACCCDHIGIGTGFMDSSFDPVDHVVAKQPLLQLSTKKRSRLKECTEAVGTAS